MKMVLEKAVFLKNIIRKSFLILQYVMAVAFTVATNERSFSKLKLVETSLRTTIDKTRLNDLIITFTEKDMVDGVLFENIITSRAALTKRRIRT